MSYNSAKFKKSLEISIVLTERILEKLPKKFFRSEMQTLGYHITVTLERGAEEVEGGKIPGEVLKLLASSLGYVAHWGWAPDAPKKKDLGFLVYSLTEALNIVDESMS